LRGKRGDTSKHSWKTLPLEVERTQGAVGNVHMKGADDVE
jgi:hypothetical protein